MPCIRRRNFSNCSILTAQSSTYEINLAPPSRIFGGNTTNPSSSFSSSSSSSSSSPPCPVEFFLVLVLARCRMQKCFLSNASSSPQSQQPPCPGGRSLGMRLKKMSCPLVRCFLCSSSLSSAVFKATPPPPLPSSLSTMTCEAMKQSWHITHVSSFWHWRQDHTMSPALKV